MTNAELIETYESILAVTALMLGAARADEWDRLIALQQDCRKLVEGLAAACNGKVIVLEPEVRRRKVEIIRTVLAHDAEIRNLTEPWMQRLQYLLTSVGHERKLNAAYGAGTAV